MARNVNDILKSLPASRRRKIEKRAAALIAEEMTLQELRRARAMTQVRLAKNLGVAQKQVSEIEKRTDMHISTLRRSIEAMGGKLSLVAEFPDRKPVVLSGITSIDS
ncbi:MAG TPA: helix-turn-helix domain-containing protein [Terracidiphilus sp.]|nr:helix-turn-helix domain-containing protein [Terracidiphilus sp.]